MSSATLTRREAAELSGVGLKRLDREIADGAIEPVREGGRSLLGIGDVRLLVVMDALNVPLGLELKRRVRDLLEDEVSDQLHHYAIQLRGDPKRVVPSWTTLHLGLTGPLELRLDEPLARRLADAEEYVRFVAEDVVRDPGVRGGEPVVKGTRIPVRSLAAKIAVGETVEVLREDFPQVPERVLRFAPLWARANPRRGRPRQPWLGE